jgi:hypothetical protein
VFELLHTPPLVASVSVIDAPTQNAVMPPIEAGVDGTVITLTVFVWKNVPQLLVTV